MRIVDRAIMSGPSSFGGRSRPEPAPGAHMRLLVEEAVSPLRGDLVIPASKYHAHRALILGSLAAGTTVVEGISDARHVEFTVAALRALGTGIDVRGDSLAITGGPYRPRRPRVSFGSSGST
ncbi:MAG TPA: hypothetical protein VFW86_06510, partial [Candidatus Limnocylindrales bacterium]|nr:hypothetical protein [Candidatus Limnocylindrales bacterium]